jgi:hypothetical protein
MTSPVYFRFPLRFAGRFCSGLNLTALPFPRTKTSLTGLRLNSLTADFR